MLLRLDGPTDQDYLNLEEFGDSLFVVLRTAQLEDGDRISMGQTELVFERIGIRRNVRGTRARCAMWANTAET